MKKLIILSLFLALSSTAAFADEGTQTDDVGTKISNFFRKLNPAPFLQEQERKYKERKATSQSQYLGKDAK